MSKTIRLSRNRFEHLVAKALAGLPEEFLSRLENIVLLIENEPPNDMPGTLGIYEGVPLTERASYDTVLPDRITLFKRPIERICRTEKEIENEVRLTVRHEVGHFFGMEEDQLEQI